MAAVHSLSKSGNRLLLSYMLIIVFLGISTIGILYEPFEAASARIANRNYNGEGFIELLEAVFWLGSSVIFALLLFQKDCPRKTRAWLVFFVLFCFVAFGEEVSWGQHLFGLEVPEVVKEINVQHEINLHNLNISHFIGIEEGDSLYPYLRNFNSVLNPLFYLICGLLWVVYPLFKKMGIIKVFSSLPTPLIGTTIFCGTNILLYLTVDKMLFDIGEIFELSLSLVAILFALDTWDQRNREEEICKPLHEGTE